MFVSNALRIAGEVASLQQLGVGGGARKNKRCRGRVMPTIEQSIEVEVPVSMAYNQ
jgi:hypothetical protein